MPTEYGGVTQVRPVEPEVISDIVNLWVESIL
jgi:hypothetical protein